MKYIDLSYLLLFVFFGFLVWADREEILNKESPADRLLSFFIYFVSAIIFWYLTYLFISHIEKGTEDPIKVALPKIAIAYLLYKIADIGMILTKDVRVRKMPAIGRYLFPKKLSYKEIERAAVHEAGHALITGALCKLPKKFNVYIKRHQSWYGIVGGTTMPKILRDSYSKTQLEAESLVLLGGLTAEEIIYSEHYTGSQSDLMKWTNAVENYFLDGYKEGYYKGSNHSTDYRSHNLELIDSFGKEQRALLRDFFESNKEAICSIRDELLKKKKLGVHEIQPFIDKLLVPSKLQELRASLNRFDL
jgi:Peptidase family M41